MTRKQTPAQADTQTEWHGFNWTADGHIPKIDTRTPSQVQATKAAGWPQS